MGMVIGAALTGIETHAAVLNRVIRQDQPGTQDADRFMSCYLEHLGHCVWMQEDVVVEEQVARRRHGTGAAIARRGEGMPAVEP